MKVSTSILSIKSSVEDSLNELNDTSTDYLHLDVMDGKFVEANTIEKMDEALKYNAKPLDIHLMVEDIEYYINKYQVMIPEYITFHIETTDDAFKVIKKLKDLNIKVGITCKPNTDLSTLIPYLSEVDLVLIMSVEPGLGGQKFIESSTDKINYLKELRESNNYRYLIEVDGGINDETVNKVSNADILVSGSYITNGNYEENICKLKSK